MNFLIMSEFIYLRNKFIWTLMEFRGNVYLAKYFCKEIYIVERRWSWVVVAVAVLWEKNAAARRILFALRDRRSRCAIYNRSASAKFGRSIPVPCTRIWSESGWLGCLTISSVLCDEAVANTFVFVTRFERLLAVFLFICCLLFISRLPILHLHWYILHLYMQINRFIFRKFVIISDFRNKL